MDLHVRLTWLLLLSTTLLSEPASGTWWNNPDRDPNSLWNKFTDWLKETFQPKGSSPAPSPTPAQTETPPAAEIVTILREDVSSAPAAVIDEIGTPATEIPATADKASESPTESNWLPAEFVAVTTPAAEILSTLAEASTDYSATEAENLSTAAPARGNTEPSTTSAPQPTVREATVALSSAAADVTPAAATPSPAAADVTPEAATPSPAAADITPAASTAAPAGSATPPAEDTTPGAAVTAESTKAESPETASPAPPVPPTPEATAIATTHPKTNAATAGSADLTPLPDNVKQLLLIYLNRLCQPRRPGMPKVTVEGCVKDPTCGNRPLSGQRLFQLRYRAPVQPRVCLRCKVSGCNVSPPPPRPFPGNRLPFPPRPFPGNRLPFPPRPFPGNRLPFPPRPFPGNRLPFPPRPFPGNSFPFPPRPFPGNRGPLFPGFPGSRRAKRSTDDGVVVVVVPQQ